MLPIDTFEVLFERRNKRIREHGNTILFPLAIANDDLTVLEVDIFDAQTQPFE